MVHRNPPLQSAPGRRIMRLILACHVAMALVEAAPSPRERARVTGPGAIPPWYTQHRTHAHTRLSALDYCHQTGVDPHALCTFSPTVNGRSPGATLGHVAAATVDDCKQSCCETAGCQAVIFQGKNCSLLPRRYNTNFQPSNTAQVANVLTANRTGLSNWTCDAVFEDAAALFANLSVPAFVRHSHTGSEGTWWPSATGPKESWLPLVQDTGRNLPLEFLTKAKAAGVHVILYHYMKCNTYWATARPEWSMQWPNGSTIVWPRGPGMSPCSPEWRALYIAQVVELINMGADAFFFDEFPGTPGGDWNPACRALYKERYGEDMPTDIVTSSTRATTQPLSTSRNVLELMSDLTEQYFAELVSAIGNATTIHRTPSSYATVSTPQVTVSTPHARNAPDSAVALVSTHLVPAPDSGGSLYESTRLLSFGPHDVAKSEYSTGTRVAKCHGQQPGSSAPYPCYTAGAAAADPFADDVLAAFGWTMMRDGASGRPPHIWIPLGDVGPPPTPNTTLCTVVATRSYGMIANPDHTEAAIPNHALFDSTYTLSAMLDRTLPSDMLPVRHAAVLFSETSRNAFFRGPASDGSLDVTEAWTHVLEPTVGAFETLLRLGVPAGMVNDGQVLAPVGGPSSLVHEWPVLIAPDTSVLDPAVNYALAAYADAGGALVRLATTGWRTVEQRRVSGQALVRAINTTQRGLGPVMRTTSMGQETGDFLHSVAFASSSQPNVRVVALVNNFTGCLPFVPKGGAPLPPPPAVVGVRVDLAAPTSDGTLTSATDLISGSSYTITHHPGAADGRVWSIEVGTVTDHVMLVATFNP
eukprot:m.191684 g.191684  ORF g.191684 m.191684 type:complete len:813 (+) comp18426_c0_seq1:52-2490(+)